MDMRFNSGGDGGSNIEEFSLDNWREKILWRPRCGWKYNVKVNVK
jgi:hypothetical protein